MMKYLQKLGKALMLPVAVLPICGILMGLGYALAPGVMGVPGAATSGAAYTVGFLLVKAGGALIDNMACRQRYRLQHLFEHHPRQSVRQQPRVRRIGQRLRRNGLY